MITRAPKAFGVALVVALLLLAIVVAATVAAPPKPTSRPLPEPASTQISVSVNGAGEATVRRGWPAVIEAVIVEGAGDGELLPRAIVVDAQDRPVEWPLVRTTGSLAPATSGPPSRPSHPGDVIGSRSVYWIIEAGQTQQLADGTYAVAVQARRGDEVIAASEPVMVTVQAAPAALTSELDDQRTILEVQVAFLTGHPDDGRQKVVDWLKRRPNSVAAQTSSGDLAFADGRLAEANDAYAKAMAAAIAQQQQNPRARREPPQGLAARQRAVLRAMVKEAAATAPAAPPASGAPATRPRR